MTTSPTPMVGVDEEATWTADENWQSAQEEDVDVEMKDPGSITGKRTRNDKSPEEENREREVVTRSIKQEMIEEAHPTKAEKTANRQEEVIDLTNTDDENKSSEKSDDDEEKEYSLEESEEDSYENENPKRSEGNNGTSSEEDEKGWEKTAKEDKDRINSDESQSDDEIKIISVTPSSKTRRQIIEESSEEEIDEDTDESEKGFEIPDFKMEHSLEKRMMAKFHDLQVDKITKLSNFWYVKRNGGGYSPVALKYPTKEYGDKFKKRAVEKRRKENNAIMLALGGSPPVKGRARLRKKVTPTKEDAKEAKPKTKTRKQTQKEQEKMSTVKRTSKRDVMKDHDQKDQNKTTQTTKNTNNSKKNTTSAQNEGKKKTVTITTDTEEKTETKKATQQKLPRMDWAATASAEYKRTLMKNTWRVDISFDVDTKIDGPNDGERMTIALRTALEECLEQGQRIDSTFGIVPWKSTKPLPTLFTKQRIPKMTYEELLAYLRPPMQGLALQQVKQGRNFKWKMNTTFNGETELFVDRWSRAVLNRFYISDFPTQSEQTFCVGMCMGSTEKQILQKINKELEEVTKIEGIKASIQNIYHRGVTPALWKEARSMATGADGKIDNALKHIYAPSAIQIFVPDRNLVKPARKILYEKYGRNVEDEHGNKDAYPTWPGGAQMKFVPHAENYMSAKNREKIGERIKMHTVMKRNLVAYDLDIIDPDLELECLQGLSIGEAILKIMTNDKKNPVFRHFQHRWHPDPMVKEYRLIAHKVFQKEADACMESLKNTLVEKYGDGVLKAFKSKFKGLNNPFPIYGEEEDDIELEDDSEDKFLNKTITCQMENMEIVEKATGNTTATTTNPFADDDSQLTNLDKTVAHTNASDVSPSNKTDFSSLTDTYMKKMQQKSNSFPLWKLKSMDEMLKLEGVQKLIKARGVEESVVRAVLNIIKLNPEVNKSPDIPMDDTEIDNAQDTQQTSETTNAPGTAAADETGKTK